MNIEFLESGSTDCPLVRIYGTKAAEFASLHSLVGLAARGVGGSCSTLEVSELAASSVVLELEIATSEIGVRRASDDKNKFFWMLTPERRTVVAGLIQPFVTEARHDTHQWICGPNARYGLEVGSISILLSCSIDGSW